MKRWIHSATEIDEELYTVRYYKPDRRVNDNCKIVVKDFDSREAAMKFIDKIPEVIGDSVELWHGDDRDFVIVPEHKRRS